MEEKIILPDSPEAAQQKTVTLWVSRHGRTYGLTDEKLARWDGATHVKCNECGGVTEKSYTHCEPCRIKKANERYLAFPEKEWDEKEPIMIYDSDTYFWSGEDLADYCENHETKPSELKLVFCKPITTREVCAGDIFGDDLAEDEDIPVEIEKAFDELNAKLKAYTKPLSWTQGKIRVIGIKDEDYEYE